MRKARFDMGDWVLVRDPRCVGRKNFVGEIVVVNRRGGGIYYGTEPSYDLQGWFENEDEPVLLKHIADSDVEMFELDWGAGQGCVVTSDRAWCFDRDLIADRGQHVRRETIRYWDSLKKRPYWIECDVYRHTFYEPAGVVFEDGIKRERFTMFVAISHERRHRWWYVWTALVPDEPIREWMPTRFRKGG